MRRKIALAAALALCSCSPAVGLQPSTDEKWFVRERRSALTSDSPSERTSQFLRREGLAERYGREPLTVMNDLDRRLVAQRERAVAFHLAELCYHEAKHVRDGPESRRLAMASAEYAYAFLFDEALGPPASVYDPTFRWACDLYNRSLAKVLTWVARHRDRTKEIARMRFPSLACDVEAVPRGGLTWQLQEYSDVLVAYNFELTGLPGHAATSGLGVPLILVREPPMMAKRPEDRFLPRMELAYAATVLFRFQGSITERGKLRSCTADIYDPLKTLSIRVGERTVPLESDLTMPIARMVEFNPDYNTLGAMIDVERYSSLSGLYMLQPYQKDKIPLVFVHGLMSSDLTWVRLFNDLLADPVIRDRYQFWFFLYPTGNPIVVSASLLREALRNTQQTYDPDGTSAAFSRMVVVGHSMGGLVTKLQVHDSGDRLWNHVSDKKLEDMDLTENQRKLLRQSLFFERQRYISRVIFMATPHRGSKVATGLTGWIGSSLIRLPGNVVSAADAVARESGRDHGDFERSITSVGNLRPDSRMLVETIQWEFPADLPYHSVIGDEDEAGKKNGTDGLVPYWSSHLDGARSEKIVESGHNVHENQQCILELRRILRLHPQESRQGRPE